MGDARHPLHSMSSYLGSFPPSVPRKAINTWVAKKSHILDPFCGSGTTLVESVLAGYDCIGVDLNPLAVAVSRAKTQHVEVEDVLDRIRALARLYPGGADVETVPDDVKTIFHPRTLAQLVFIREHLEYDRPEDVFLRGCILGIMHGKFRRDGSTAYLSIDMPNTFSMSPEYVRKFVRKHRLVQPPVDVFSQLRGRSKHLLRSGPLPGLARCKVLHGDATQLPKILDAAGQPTVDAIVTSPPYLGVLRYGAFNWIRLWFLGYSPGEVDRGLDSTDSLDRYLSFMSSFLVAAGEVLRPGSPLVLVIGDVVEHGTHLKLATRVWEDLGDLVPFRFSDVERDIFDEGIKTTRIWGEGKKGRATPLDRILVLTRETPTPRRTKQASDLGNAKAGARKH